MSREGSAASVLTRLTGAAAAAVLVLALAATPAYAGDWMQAVCVNPNASAATNQGWAPVASTSDPNFNGIVGFFTPNPGGNTNVTGCMFAAITSAAAGDSAYFEYTPPSGSTINGGSLAIAVYDPPMTSSGGSGSAPLLVPIAWTVGANGSDFFVGSSSVSPAAVTATIPSGENPANVDVGFVTQGSGAGSCPSHCTLQVNSGEVLLANYSIPFASGFGGSLLASGPAYGIADLVLTASDPNGPGVYRVTVTVDGKSVYQATPNAEGGSCAPEGTDPLTGAWIFDGQQPCPATVGVDVPVDTATLRNGEHQVQVLVEDAARNTATVLDRTFIASNPTRTPVPRGRRSVHAEFVFKSRWNGARTWLVWIRSHHVPGNGNVTVRCLGQGCRRLRVANAAAAGVPKLLRGLDGHRFDAGDRLLITVTAPHRTPERIEILFRRGRAPLARLLTK